MKCRIRVSLLALLLALVCVFMPVAQAYAASLTAPDSFTAQAVAQEIDAYIAEHEATTAGVSIAMVRGEETLYRTDHGYVDIAAQRAVDGDTVFEWGSVTKLLVWTSVMQLVEQGRLDLDAPIADYLPPDFLRRLSYDEPITMMNLMHHDAGWEDVLVELFVKPENATLSLEEALQKYEPRQNRKPGEAVGYSNYGVALAGYIVERIAGEPFYEYVSNHIFVPLGMAHTSVHPTLADNDWVRERRVLSKGYATDRTPLTDMYAIPLYPAGMATGTMDDFTLFCKALLPAEGENSPLFASRETLDLMLSPSLFYGESGLGRNSHGFWIFEYEAPMLGHSGNTAAFSAHLLIHPESRIGLLVMSNQANEGVYNSGLSAQLFGEPTFTAGGEGAFTDARTLRGVYQSSRLVLSGFAKLYSVMMTIPLPYATEDSLSLSIFGQNIITLRETAPNIFLTDAASALPLFNFMYTGTTPAGHNTLQMPYMEFVQGSTWLTLLSYALLLLLVLAALACVVNLLVSFLGWAIRLIRRRTVQRSSAYRGQLLLSVLGIGALANIIGGVVSLLSYASRTMIIMHIVVNIAYIVIAVVGLFILARQLRKAEASRSDRARCRITGFATLVIIANMLYWNLCWL